MGRSFFSSASNIRRSLVIIWFGAFTINMLIVFLLFFMGWIWPDDFTTALKQLVTSYAPYLGLITAFYWGNIQNKVARGKKGRTALYLALYGSLTWNAMIILFTVSPLLGLGSIEATVDYINEIGSWLSFLVAGAVGYYFANSATPQGQTAK